MQQHKFNANSQIVTLFSDEMGLTQHFFSPGSRQEVNSTWYPEIEEPIKSCEKHYSLVLYILSMYISSKILYLCTVLDFWFKMGKVQTRDK